MKNTGKEFEKIVAEIHRNFDSNSKITENETINGRQIDVAIRTTAGSYPILIIVECKDYKRKVEIGKVDELIGKVSDVRAAKGILVSNSGFSSCAVKRAKLDGRIQLSSVIDINNEKLRARIGFPAVCEQISPTSYKLRVSHNKIGPMKVNHKDMFKLRRKFLELWNEGKLDNSVGQHQYEIDDVPVEEGEVKVTYFYDVSRAFLSGCVNMSDGEGIFDFTGGSFVTKDFTISLEASEIQKWKQVEEKDIPAHALRFLAIDRFAIPENIADVL